jgi:hypothetical protein
MTNQLIFSANHKRKSNISFIVIIFYFKLKYSLIQVMPNEVPQEVKWDFI